MKKKYIVIILIIIFVISIVTNYVDSARVRNGIEPKFTIKIINDDGGKITYWGLGYKIIRYVSVSPNEPYQNNKGIKFGSWFMQYELNDSDVINIIDRTEKDDNLACEQELEKIYEDNAHEYFLPCIKSQYIIVEYKDGLKQNIKTALADEKISIKELEDYKINIIIKKKSALQ